VNRKPEAQSTTIAYFDDGGDKPTKTGVFVIFIFSGFPSLPIKDVKRSALKGPNKLAQGERSREATSDALGYSSIGIASPERAAQSHRVSPFQGLFSKALPTQGGAALCPGLDCGCPFGAENHESATSKSVSEGELRTSLADASG
jgi:hypothetical protein